MMVYCIYLFLLMAVFARLGNSNVRAELTVTVHNWKKKKMFARKRICLMAVIINELLGVLRYLKYLSFAVKSQIGIVFVKDPVLYCLRTRQ